MVLFHFSEVPQGSNFGALLFKLFIDELNTVTIIKLIFEDDCKVLRSVSDVTDSHDLPTQLTNIDVW